MNDPSFFMHTVALAREACRWDALFTLRGHAAAVTAVCILECAEHSALCNCSPKGVSFVSGDANGAVNVWRDGRRVMSWQASGSNAGIVAIASMGCSRVLVQTRACRVHVLSLVDSSVISVCDFAPSANEHSFCRFAVRLDNGNALVAVPCVTGDVALYALAGESAALVQRIPEPAGAGIVTCIKWLHVQGQGDMQSHLLCTGHDDGCAYIRDSSGAVYRRLKLFPMTVTALDVRFDAGCASLAATGPQKGVVLIRGVLLRKAISSEPCCTDTCDTKGAMCSSVLPDEGVIRSEEARNEGFADVVFLNSCSRASIATAGWDGKLRLFDGNLGMLAVIPAAADTLESLCAHHICNPAGLSDPRRPILKHKYVIAAASKDRTVTVYCAGQCCL